MSAGIVEQTAPAPILEEIEASRRRARFAFRATFAFVWAAILAGLVIAFAATDNIDADWISTWAPYILGGAGITILVCVCSITLATGLALLGALGRLSSNAVVYAIASFYVSLVRGTPLLVQIYIIFFSLPLISRALIFPAIVAGIIALGFNYGAYMTEIFRAGIQAIPRGQIEAAHSIGMTDRLTMRRVVLPQAIRIVTPAIGNEFIAMIKDSALVSIIGVQELLWRAQTVGSSKFRSLETLLLAALIYWVLSLALSLFQDRLEQRMAESDRRI
jgi:polar amino acid transport system permease protein